eukprot:NODE_2272_length_2251_cov_10.414313.p1 GENE.NODE_2272_length_2251_cov_10.414313~~NODE_2272_length_2251_cov_10.414313.p1  ORF type:complete len:609 (+),score=165.11 NODE_2272_length_2251_cov_10.414313:111-1937(+)
MFVNNTCLPLCDDSAVLGAHCVSTDEVYKLSGSDTSLHLASAIVQDYYKAAEVNASLPTTTSHFVKSAHKLKMNLNYNVVQPASFFKSAMLISTANAGTVTVVLGSTGEVHDIVQSLDSLAFSIEEVAALGGYADFLNSTLPDAGVNQLQGAAITEGPVARLSGIQFYAELYCTNDPDDDVEASSASGIICFLSFEPSGRYWLTYNEVFPTGENGVVRRRTYYAMNIELRPSSSFSVLDPYQVYLQVVSVFVILRLPMLFMKVLVTKGLGRLSPIYDRAINEPFDVHAEICATSLSTLTAQATFALMVDEVDGISKLRFKDALKAALSAHRDLLDDVELDALAQICFERVVRRAQNPRSNGMFPCLGSTPPKRLGHIMSDKAKEKATARAAESISADELVHAALSFRRVGISELAKLFDVDRAPCFLERLFMPGQLRNLGARVAAVRDCRPAADEPPLPPPPTEAESGAGTHAAMTSQTVLPPGALGFRAPRCSAACSGAAFELSNNSNDPAGLIPTEELRQLHAMVEAMLVPVQQLIADVSDKVARQDCRIAEFEGQLRAQLSELDASRQAPPSMQGMPCAQMVVSAREAHSCADDACLDCEQTEIV